MRGEVEVVKAVEVVKEVEGLVEVVKVLEGLVEVAVVMKVVDVVKVMVAGERASVGVSDQVGVAIGESVGGVGGKVVVGGVVADAVSGVTKVSEAVCRTGVVAALGDEMVEVRLVRLVVVMEKGGSVGSGATECQQKGELCSFGVTRKQRDRARQRGPRPENQFNVMFGPRIMSRIEQVVTVQSDVCQTRLTTRPISIASCTHHRHQMANSHKWQHLHCGHASVEQRIEFLLDSAPFPRPSSFSSSPAVITWPQNPLARNLQDGEQILILPQTQTRLGAQDKSAGILERQTQDLDETMQLRNCGFRPSATSRDNQQQPPTPRPLQPDSGARSRFPGRLILLSSTAAPSWRGGKCCREPWARRRWFLRFRDASFKTWTARIWNACAGSRMAMEQKR